MNWIPELLKHLSAVKSAAFALFVAMAVAYIGPMVLPNYFELVPSPWSILVASLFWFSGALLFVWVTAAVTSWIAGKAKKAGEHIRSLRLSNDEARILVSMGQNPRAPLNLERVRYEDIPWSRLELGALVEKLQRKGLLEKLMFASELVSLTSRGCKKALEIEQRTRANEISG